MELERNSLRTGLTVILWALGLRLALGLLQPMAAALSQPETGQMLLYLETGQMLLPAGEQTAPTAATEPEQTEPEQSRLQFTDAHAALISLKDYSGYSPDTAALLQEPLSWNLRSDKPTVLILHTHATECYLDPTGQLYEASSPYRTTDSRYNMTSLGALLAQLLEQEGIGVIHDATLHDYPVYNGSYGRARSTISAYLAKNPQICLVLDLHRDAVEDSGGGQLKTEATVDGQSAAQLMFVVGTDAGGLEHPDYSQNLALACKLQAVLEGMYPGLCRSIRLRTERFNQDLSPGALIVEIGGAGNTLQEAEAAVRALAKGIAALADGSG